MTRQAATGIAVDGASLILAADDVEMTISLGPAELVAIATALLTAARAAYGRSDWPPSSASHFANIP